MSKKKENWSCQQFGSAAIVKGKDQDLEEFRKSFSKLLNVDIRDFMNIQFVANEEENLPQKRRAIDYLKNCLEIPPEKVDDPTSIEEFHPELIGKQCEVPPIENFTQLPIRLPFFHAAFLVECFALDQELSEQSSCNKRFAREKTIYQLLLIAPLPVAFEIDPKTKETVLTFADTNVASAKLIHDQVVFAQGIFVVKSIGAMFQKVDVRRFRLKKIQKISEKLGCAVLRSMDMETYLDAGNVMLYILPSKFGQIPRNKIKMVLDSEFEEIQLFKCAKCGREFSLKSKEKCLIDDEVLNKDDVFLEFDRHEPQGTTVSFFNFQVF